MDKQGIKLAREWLDLPDTLTDEEIAEGLSGSFTETRIKLHLVWNEFKQAVKRLFVPIDDGTDERTRIFIEAMQPIAQAFEKASRPFDRRNQ